MFACCSLNTPPQGQTYIEGVAESVGVVTKAVDYNLWSQSICTEPYISFAQAYKFTGTSAGNYTARRVF